MHGSIPLAESGFSPRLNHNGMSSQQTDDRRSVGKCNKRGLCASPPVKETAKIDIGMKDELFFSPTGMQNNTALGSRFRGRKSALQISYLFHFSPQNYRDRRENLNASSKQSLSIIRVKEILETD